MIERDESLPGLLPVHLAVDQALVARGYRELLARRWDYVVCGVSRSPEECLESAPLQEARIVLFDLRAPGHEGLGWVTELKRRHPAVRVLMLREYLAPDLVSAALAAGVDAALVRTEDPLELYLALDALRRGQGFLSRRLGLPSPGPDMGGGGRDTHRLAAVQALDHLERRAFVELALGHDSARIAEVLGIDAEAAGELVRELRERLDCASGADLTRLAIRSGVLPVDPT